MALGALINKARLGLSDEELVKQIKENPYLQFFNGAFYYSSPFDPSMMVYFLKRLIKPVVNDCNNRSVRHGLEVIQASDSQDADDNGSNGGSSTDHAEQSISSTQKPLNQGSLLIDATCTPIDIRYPTDLSLLNEARELTEILIDAMHPVLKENVGNKPRTHFRKAR
jgi:IS5 family transposase